MESFRGFFCLSAGLTRFGNFASFYIFSNFQGGKKLEANVPRIQRDVRLVMGRAAIVLRILNDEEVEIIRNARYTLNVIAITGMDYDGEVLLEEVGLHRTKPFRASQIGRIGRKLGKPGRRTCMPARSKFFELTTDQYQQVAPVIFHILQETVNERVASWRRGPKDPYRILCPQFHYDSRRNKLYLSWKDREWPRGLRFSVRKDSFFARDVCWAELNSNDIIQNYLNGFAGFIDLCLSKHQRGWRRRCNFEELKGVRQIGNVLAYRKLPRHLLIETMQYLAGGREKNYLWVDMAQYFGWDGTESEEKGLSLKVLTDPDPISRLGRIQIRVVKVGKHCLTFEVFPKT